MLSQLRVLVSTLILLAATALVGAPPAQAAGNSISVDVGAPTGVIQPGLTGQMMEWASDAMNGAWAERVRNRSFETDEIASRAGSTLYDGFTGSTLDRSKWTPVSLDTSSPGTVAVSGSTLAITQTTPSRFGVLTNPLPHSRYTTVSIETKLVGASGVNGLLNVYGGTGSGDFTKFVEFGVEGGVLKVFADGLPTWTGPAASLPAVLRADVGPLAGTTRSVTFSYNGTPVYTLNNVSGLAENYRAMLYGWGGTVSYDYLSVTPDATYDTFLGSTLSPRWTPTAVAGSAGSVAVGSSAVTIAGAAASRYGILSDYIPNSSTEFTTVTSRVTSVSGTNALMSIYGGNGAGDFSKFVEFGVEGGVAKVYTHSGAGNWTGGAVSLPATLKVSVSPWWSNGRQFRFYVNDALVHTLQTDFNVPKEDFRVFLYGYGTSTTTWDYVNVSQVSLFDRWDAGFESDGAVNGAWAQTTLAGGWGTAGQLNGRVTINGVAGSRYGLMSPTIDESDIYGTTVEAKLDAYSGTNALLSLYAGNGRGDFSKFVEFGVEGGNLRVFGDGLPSWTGPAIAAPVVLRAEVSAWGPSGRTIDFFANNRFVYSLEGITTLPARDFRVFIYGYGASVTTWDYVTMWRQGGWRADGYGDVAVTTRTRGAAPNGTWARQITLTNHGTGRQGISQGGMPVVAGRAYQVSMYLKATGSAAPVTVTLGPNTGDRPGYPAYATGSFSGVTGTWAKYTTTLTPSTTDTLAKLQISATGVGVLSVDMVSVMPTHPSEVVHGGWRTDFVNALVALNPRSLRWPGGIIADSYNWKDGVGARDTRRPQYYGQWNSSWMTNDVGTHEILTLGEALGIPVILNVNWGGGTSSLAAEWVQYTNGSTATTFGAQRAANGRSAPFNVRTWEIGNEVWGPWTVGYTNASTFATSYNSFQAAMAAVDPTVSFIGEGGDGTNNDQTWNTTMVQTSASRLDHLAVHYYSPQRLPDNYDSAAVYAASVGAPVTIATRMATSRSTILANTKRDIKLAVTEHNAMYFSDENRRTRTLEGALQMGGLLNLFARNADVNEVNAASTLMEFWDGSSIRLGVRGSFVTPSYLVQSLAANQRGSLLLPTSVTSGTYAAPAMGNLPAQPAVPFLDVTSTRSPDGTATYLSVVNRDPVNSQLASISLANAGAVGTSATVYRVNSPGYLDRNSWQSPTAVSTVTSTITGVGSSFTHTFPAHSYTVIKLTTTAAALSGTRIIGQVTNAAGAPLAGVTVTSSGGGSATTNAQGFYRITAPGTGTVSLTASAPGYATYVRTSVQVSSLGATPLPIRLT